MSATRRRKQVRNRITTRRPEAQRKAASPRRVSAGATGGLIDIPVGAVRVGRRFRNDLGELDSLAASIRERGLLQPIGVTPDGRLVFGHRRLVVCKNLLGWKTIPARVLNITNLVNAEIDENEIRRAFTASERVAIVDALRGYGHGGDRRSDQRRSSDDGVLTVEEAAARVGWGRDSYFRAKAVVDKGVPELVEAMDSGDLPVASAALIAAVPHAQQQVVLHRGVGQERITQQVVRKVVRHVRRDHERDDAPPVRGRQGGLPPAVQLHHCRFQDLEATAGIKPGTVKLILTDIPYEKSFLPQISDLSGFAARVLRDGGALVTYSGVMDLPEVLNRLGEHLSYHWTGGMAFTPEIKPVHPKLVKGRWRAVLVFSKGRLTLPRYFVDFLIEYDQKSKDWHEWGQSVAGVEHWLRYFSGAGDLVVDPCGGGFATAVACLQNNRRCISCDVDSTAVANGRRRVSEASVTPI